MATNNNVEVITEAINGTTYFIVYQNGFVVKTFTDVDKARAYADSIRTPAPVPVTPKVITILIELKQMETVGNEADGGTTVHYLTYRDGQCVNDTLIQWQAMDYYTTLVANTPPNSVVVLKSQEFERV